MLVVVPTVAMMSQCSSLFADAQPDVYRITSLGSTQSMTSTTVTPQQVSEAAKEEGGTSKGSKSAQLQSELDKQIKAQGGANSDANAGLVLCRLLHHPFH